ncbi:MAG: glycoside hydrolase family 36 N-terminal domain-containing protein, partial [Bacteroidota bacterium]
MRYISICLCLYCCLPIIAQQVITIESKDYAMVMQTDGDKRLRHVYFGEKLEDQEEYQLIAEQLRYDGVNEDVFNHIYTPSGTWNIAEPALSITHADGNPSTELHITGKETKRLQPS